jgi:thioredoxin 1|tara:strand:- start:199 stop:480 length:282 start_codon:yes stop_codon:yes gene_type:complete
MTKADLQSGKILVDFYATWCGPCKMVAKTIEKYEEEINDVTVIKINVDEDSEIAGEYGVRSIPTLIYMEHGEIIDRKTGNMSLEDLKIFTKQI